MRSLFAKAASLGVETATTERIASRKSFDTYDANHLVAFGCLEKPGRRAAAQA